MMLIYLLTNMDNMRITIPTSKALNWVFTELNDIYLSYKSVNTTE